MPAAAVIPAPIAYTKVVAVKKLVVGSWSVHARSLERAYCAAHSSLRLRVYVLLTECITRPEILP